MSKSIRTFFISIAPLALLGLGAQVHAQANDVDCYHCVDTRDIAANAVITGKLKKHAVTQSKIGKNAVTTNKIKNYAVTSDKLSDEVFFAISESIGGIILEQMSVSDGSGVASLVCPAGTLVGSANCNCDFVNGSRNFGVLFMCQVAGNGGVAGCFNHLFDPILPFPLATITLSCVSALQTDGTPITPVPFSKFPSGLVKIDNSGMDFESAVNNARATVAAQRDALQNR